MTDGEVRVLESGDNGTHPDAAAAAAPEPIELTEAVLEALLFVAERPLSRREIAALAGTDRETVDARLGDLEVSLRARGIRLVLSGDRVELVTAPEAGALIARYVGADAVRLSPASLETLAIVAYRQPVTRSAIERIRGVDSDYTVRTLLHRRLIVELGRSDAPGRPFLYGTGFDFLERFGLTSLDELPPLEVDVAARLAEEGGGVLPAEPSVTPGEPDPRLTGLAGNAGPARLMPAERVQKVLAAAGVASRRASEDLIAQGRVTVDGRVAKVGDQADPARSVIAVDGRVIGAAAQTAYLLLHKPAGVTSTTSDRHAERTVLDLVPTALVPEGARLYPVGRLDQDSEGLLVLTNDGAWAERLLHPRYGVEREYALGLRARLTREQLDALRQGIELDEGVAELRGLRPLDDAIVQRIVGLMDPPPPQLAWYRAVLTQGWKRQLRRMFAAVGAPVDRLVRVRIGPVRIDGLRSGRVAIAQGARGARSRRRWRSLPRIGVPSGSGQAAATLRAGILPPDACDCAPDGGACRCTRRTRFVGQEQRGRRRGPRARLPLLRHGAAVPRDHLAGARSRGRQPRLGCAGRPRRGARARGG